MDAATFVQIHSSSRTKKILPGLLLPPIILLFHLAGETLTLFAGTGKLACPEVTES
jgi:hypothetical protein